MLETAPEFGAATSQLHIGKFRKRTSIYRDSVFSAPRFAPRRSYLWKVHIGPGHVPECNVERQGEANNDNEHDDDEHGNVHASFSDGVNELGNAAVEVHVLEHPAKTNEGVDGEEVQGHLGVRSKTPDVDEGVVIAEGLFDLPKFLKGEVAEEGSIEEDDEVEQLRHVNILEK